jgi:hypothetical protein
VVCIPIKEEMFTSPGSEYEGGKYTDFKALKTSLKGDYSHLPKAWDKAHAYITEKALQENTTGTYIELYSKGVAKSKRPSEWITDLYIPIGAPTILPVTDSIQAPAAVVPVKPAALKPTTQGARPATTTANKPAGTTAKPAATGTGTKPAPTGSKPATSTTKPAGATSTGTTAAKPAPKPAAPKPATKTTTP